MNPLLRTRCGKWYLFGNGALNFSFSLFQRCVVIQEVFPEGVIAQDGRLQSGDQIIEIDGVDMTAATHSHVCQELRKFIKPTLRLGIYRELIQSHPSSGSPSATNNNNNTASATSLNSLAGMHICMVIEQVYLRIPHKNTIKPCIDKTFVSRIKAITILCKYYSETNLI